MAEGETALELPDDLESWLTEQCSYLMRGFCATRGCFLRGGYNGKGPVPDTVHATCEAKELYRILRKVRRKGSEDAT